MKNMKYKCFKNRGTYEKKIYILSDSINRQVQASCVGIIKKTLLFLFSSGDIFNNWRKKKKNLKILLTQFFILAIRHVVILITLIFARAIN